MPLLLASLWRLGMLKAFKTLDDAVSCRSCGATHASPHSNKWGICGECYTKFKYRNGKQELTDEAVTEQLARELMLTTKRLHEHGQIGRCEAVSSWYYKNMPRDGYQCAHKAVTTKDGRRVCTLHAKALQPHFVGEKASDPYEVVTNLVSELASHDERFRLAIERALT